MNLISGHSSDKWLEILQSNGYRITNPRRIVVDIIASTNHILNPLQVYEMGRTRYPKLGLVTVYRTIDKLVELDLLQRVHQPSNCQGFVPAFQGHQHLLICDECGLVSYFKGDEGELQPFLVDVEKNSGFKVDDHWLQFFGRCAQCQHSEV